MWKEVGFGGSGALSLKYLKIRDPSTRMHSLRDDKPVRLVNFCANNYLGLASSDELAEAAIEGIKNMDSVRHLSGLLWAHQQSIKIWKKKEIAKFFGTEDAITYTSCFDANTGLFETILKEGARFLATN